MNSSISLLWSVLFGGIGLGFFIYGKKQRAIIPFAVGVALFIFPYFMPNSYMLVSIGAILVAIPYFIRI